MIYYQPRHGGKHPVRIDDYDHESGVFSINIKPYSVKRCDLRADGGQEEISDRIAELTRECRKRKIVTRPEAVK